MELTYLFIIIFLGFVSRSILGFGFSALIFPLLILANFKDPHILTIFYEFVISIYFGIKYFKINKLKIISSLVLFSILGVILGYIIENNIQQISLLFSIPLLITIIISFLIKFDLSNNKIRILKSKVFLSILSGCMTILSGISGPPIVLYSLTRKKGYLDFKSTLSMYFFILYLVVFLTQVYNIIEHEISLNFTLLFTGALFVIAFCFLYDKINLLIDSYLGKKSESIKEIAFWFLLIICLASLIKIL